MTDLSEQVEIQKAAVLKVEDKLQVWLGITEFLNSVYECKTGGQEQGGRAPYSVHK